VHIIYLVDLFCSLHFDDNFGSWNPGDDHVQVIESHAANGCEISAYVQPAGVEIAAMVSGLIARWWGEIHGRPCPFLGK
jgi:hypothetical protein